MTRIDRLGDCGWRPNCVSSNASNPRRRIGPWALRAAAPEVWRAARELVLAAPRTRIVAESEGWLHAEARSRIFGFVDDLELALDAERGLLGARSAARVGLSDRGVNRRRVERLRRELVARRLIEE